MRFVKILVVVGLIALYIGSYISQSPLIGEFKVALTFVAIILALPILYRVWRTFFLALTGRTPEAEDIGIPISLHRLLILEANLWRKAWQKIVKRRDDA
ncbi:MAG TPA: hypothetical protein PKC97_11275 [Burkholderiaceae bacterium]|nr:hypothetical protein [Burkholderiaceae bacterium]